MRIVVAITGATGAIIGIRLLERLGTLGVETHLVISEWGERTIAHETDYSVTRVRALASVAHSVRYMAATIASGSFATDGMIVVPCSVKTLAGISSGYADNLILRAADVTLKERRKLLLVVRETPLSDIHLTNMLRLSRMGASIFPPVPAFYNHPRSLDDLIDHLVSRIVDQFGLDDNRDSSWDGRLTPSSKHNGNPE